MIPVSNRATWEGFFQKNVIKNCNFKITSINGTGTEFDASNFKSFKLEETGGMFYTEFPTRHITFEFLKYDTFVSHRNDFGIGAVLSINYCVENTWLNGKLPIFVVTDIKDDKYHKTVSITAKSFLELMFDVPEVTFFTTSNTSPYYHYKTIDSVFTTIINECMLPTIHRLMNFTLTATPNADVNNFYIGDDGVHYGLIPIWYNNSGSQWWLDLMQNLSCYSYHYLNTSNGVVEFSIKGLEDTFYNTTSSSYVISADGNFDKMNIFDVNYVQEEDDAVEIGICSGANPKDINAGDGSSHEIESDVFINIYALISDYGVIYPNSKITSKAYTLKLETQGFMFDGINIKNQVGSNNKKLLAIHYNGYRTETAQLYLNHHNFMVIDGRIDPTIECGDIIQTVVDNQSVKLAIEEISWTFESGFQGTIKGRVMDTIVLSAPVVSNVTCVYPDDEIEDWSFTISNNNNIAVSVKIGSLNQYPAQSGAYASFNVPANSSITIHRNDINVIVRALVDEYFDDYYIQGSLQKPLYCWFKYNDITSDNSFILEEM